MYIDGKKCGSVRNDGNGGPNCYSTGALQSSLDKIAKATMQPYTFGKITIQPDADFIVDELLVKHLREKDFNKLIKSRVVVLEHDGRITQTKAVKPDQLDAWLKIPTLAQHMGNPKAILNLLPREEAINLYMEACHAEHQK